MGKIAVITGSSGLVGSEAVRFFSDKFDWIVGIDNNKREKLFNASVVENGMSLHDIDNFIPVNMDINEVDDAFLGGFTSYGKIDLIVHCAAQPSHDYATNNVMEDFTINAMGTAVLLEAVRRNCPDAVFIFCSTNKVYGDYPNDLPYTETETRYNFPFPFDENTPIDKVKHSFFGCSKLAADLYVQEYGKYLGMKTGVFRCGCITGPNHAGAELHGFLSYLIKCVKHGLPYTVFGYKSLQVRDQIHSYDLITAFHEFYKDPKQGEVFNIGGGYDNSCSVLEAMQLAESIEGKKLNYTISETARIGDHKWWITDNSKFKKHYPNWKMKYNLQTIIEEIYDKA